MDPHHAHRFEALDEDRARPWSRYAQWDTPYLAKHLGMQLEEVRAGYARMRLPGRVENMQPQDIVHGGAIAALIDTAVVPAIAAFYDHRVALITLGLNVDYLDAATSDVVAEAWVAKRGTTTVFCQAEVFEVASETKVATGSLIYRVRPL